MANFLLQLTDAQSAAVGESAERMGITPEAWLWRAYLFLLTADRMQSTPGARILIEDGEGTRELVL